MGPRKTQRGTGTGRLKRKASRRTRRGGHEEQMASPRVSSCCCCCCCCWGWYRCCRPDRPRRRCRRFRTEGRSTRWFWRPASCSCAPPPSPSRRKIGPSRAAETTRPATTAKTTRHLLHRETKKNLLKFAFHTRKYRSTSCYIHSPAITFYSFWKLFHFYSRKQWTEWSKSFLYPIHKTRQKQCAIKCGLVSRELGSNRVANFLRFDKTVYYSEFYFDPAGRAVLKSIIE